MLYFSHSDFAKASDVTFQLWGWPHLLILGLVPSMAGVLAWIVRTWPASARPIRISLGLLIMANELHWYVYSIQRGWGKFPNALPLELCDLTLWLTGISLLRLQPFCFEPAYYWALAGSGMALLTPNLTLPLPSYPAVQFFLAHGLVVTAILFLVWGNLARPSPGSWRRALGILNLYMVLIGLFDWKFKTNYLYLYQKPSMPSLLDVMGPWPFYVAAGDVTALLLFFALGWPFRFRGGV
jgi:hypothetical integral membrane protein (TIGR02206 family)